MSKLKLFSYLKDDKNQNILFISNHSAEVIIDWISAFDKNQSLLTVIDGQSNNSINEIDVNHIINLTFVSSSYQLAGVILRNYLESHVFKDKLNDYSEGAKQELNLLVGLASMFELNNTDVIYRLIISNLNLSNLPQQLLMVIRLLCKDNHNKNRSLFFIETQPKLYYPNVGLRIVTG